MTEYGENGYLHLKCEHKWLKINNRCGQVWNKDVLGGKNRKINNRGGNDYLGLESNQKEFRIEKVLNRKGDKLNVKWKGYDNRFNSWTDKKDLIKN